jgi:microcystin-dependent protein
MPLHSFVGQIMMFGGNFAPTGWALCNGQLLPISENDTLFNLLGTTYGGDGQTTFGLPDLRGRVPIHQGATHVIGEFSGVENVTLLTSQLSPHSHAVSTTGSASDKPATDTDPPGRVFAISNDGGNAFSATATGLLGGAISTASDGGSQPHGNMQPYTCVNFCIALYGIFPSRN